MEPVRLVRAIRDGVAAKLTTRRLNCDVNLTLWRLDTSREELEVMDQGLHGLIDPSAGRRRHLRVLDSIVASRHLLEDLAHNTDGLTNLVEANRVSVERVADGADDDIKVDFVVREIRHRAAKVPGHTRRSQDWPSRRHCKRKLGGDHSHTFSTLTKVLLAVQKMVLVVDPGLDRVDHRNDIVLPAVREIRGNATGADVVVVHPQTGGLLEEREQHVPFTKSEDHHRRRCEVHSIRRSPRDMTVDSSELGHQHSDPRCTRWHLDVEQFLDREREAELVREWREVVHARDVG